MQKLWDSWQDKDFISYKVNFHNVSTHRKDFEALSLEKQKQFLISVLDKNQLYINYVAIEDTMYSLSKEDKNLNHWFYKEG